MDHPPGNNAIRELNAASYHDEPRESQQVVVDDEDEMFPFSTISTPSAKPGVFKTTTIPALSMSVISNQTSSFDEFNGLSDSRRSHCSTCSTQRSSASDSTHPLIRTEPHSTIQHDTHVRATQQAAVLPDDAVGLSSQWVHPKNSSILLESHYLDEAASMIGSTATLFPPHQSPSVEVATSETVPPREEENKWKDFSMLLQQADDSRRFVCPSRPTPPILLPMVQEGEEIVDDLRGVARTPDPCDNSSSSSVVIVESQDPPTDSTYGLGKSNFIGLRPIPVWQNQSQSQSKQLFHASNNSNERRLAELVGASVAVSGVNTFTVSINLSAISSSPISASGLNLVPESRGMNQSLLEQQSAMKEAILDVIGNPDLLRLWCDAIPSSTSLIIVRSSEGARNAIDRSRPADANREYEGEWIEAICRPGFVVPPKSSSSRTRNCSAMGRYFMEWSSSLSALMGCPRTSGAVTMFVERRAGLVSVTLSPFPGNVQVIHRIKVSSLSNGKIRVEDTVRLRRDDDDQIPMSIFTCCSSLCEALQQCFLPALDDYVDQALSSMARLRFLIENGEEAVLRDEYTTASDSLRSDLLGLENVNDTLLMSHWVEGSNKTAADLKNPLLVRLVS
jgi:hypothetical protein